MKKRLFYSLLLVQLLCVASLIFVYEKIDTSGKEFTLQTKTLDYAPYGAYENMLYVEYESNEIDEEIWTIEDSLGYGELLYVLFEEDDEGILQVQEVSLRNHWKKLDEREVVLKASYGHEDTTLKKHFVYYRLEEFNYPTEKEEVKRGDRLQVTWKMGKWEQFKLVDTKKIE